jgi:hypothetical protein
MASCYICEADIKAGNVYKEHILLNAIGGRLKSADLICRTCSVDFDKIDAELARQLNPIGLLLDLQRERKSNPHIKATVVKTGEEVFITAGGKAARIKPDIQEDIVDGELRLRIMARDSKQMNQAISGLKRRHPWLDDQALVSHFVTEAPYMPGVVHSEIRIGGDDAFRSICKMMLNFYIYKGGKREYVDHLIPYIKGRQSSQGIWYFYPDDWNIPDVESLQVVHTLHIEGNSTEGILWGFVELFSTFRFIGLLSDEYSGKDFHKAYRYDVINRKCVDTPVKLGVSGEEILGILQARKPEIEKIEQAMSKLMSFMQMKNDKNVIRNIINNAADKYLQNNKEPRLYDRRERQRFISLILEELVPFIANRFSPFLEDEFEEE